MSLRRIVEVLDRSAGPKDQRNRGKMTVLAVAIGNLDMHSKNIGLLPSDSGEVQLAPAYEVVPLVHLSGTDGKMAMAVNKKYRHGQITSDDLIAEMLSWKLQNPEKLVDDVLSELDTAVERETPLDGAHSLLQDDIKRFIRNLMSGRAAGGSP